MKSAIPKQWIPAPPQQAPVRWIAVEHNRLQELWEDIQLEHEGSSKCLPGPGVAAGG